ncbi:OprO/OprP family phosphate-selective porin [Luteibacter aegosomaticola]|uniref:porin n=1 Tax=Luteibacter aegosomaticola TaxID=2911538 RepID=UPI001FF8FE25|nr:porin [Luteibacter aegosomaticola]UPG88529.1 OprO/OprP family phosphate-selective porin [Luteibacter aegosomaticola]
MKRLPLAAAFWTMCGTAAAEGAPQAAIELYVDTATRQIFAEPGPGRQRLGKFVQASDEAPSVSGAVVAAPARAEAPAAVAASSGVASATAPAGASAKPGASAAAAKAWYEKLSIRGYVQMRLNEGLDDGAKDLKSPGDRFTGRDQGFGIRRARVVISGDVSDRMSIYLQPDLASTPSGSTTTHFAQLRDAYADLWLDKAKTWRIRAGQSKVPYGWEDLQSSQNRIALDRADALNSGVRDERDLGLFAYWSPGAAKERFSYLQKSGLKGSGDYGMFGIGVYNGQGANRPDRNDQLHTVVHFSYPFKFDNGQYLEVGADAYTGRYVVTTGSATINGATFTPRVDAPEEGSVDRRVAAHVVYFPQPFGFQAEWTVGKGPELDVARRIIRTKSLRGGYAQLMYKFESSYGQMMPYAKWQTYRGASKFDTNAPHMEVNELEAGVEWQPSSAVELAVAFANMHRTDVSTAPYAMVKGKLMRVQLQVNY